MQHVAVTVLLMGYFYLGDAHFTESITGLSFLQEAQVLLTALLLGAVLLVVGVYLLGIDFILRLYAACAWHPEDADG